MSPSAENEYFSDGVTEEILTLLARIEGLKVISRTSVRGYQGTSKPLRQIADELKVGSVVEGSVQVEGERLRVNVQLIDAATDRHLWAERYDRTLDDAFAIQSEVAQEIVRAVGAALTVPEQGRLAAAPTTNAEAYRLYLQGQEYRNRPGFVRQDRESAQKLFEQAVALAADRIRLGEADVMIAAGTESMSMVPMGGNKPSFSPAIFEKNENIAIGYGMGVTAEKVAVQWKVSREEQDLFAAESHRKAVRATDSGEFKDEVAPYPLNERIPDLVTREVRVNTRQVVNDEGPRRDTSPEALAKLKSVFAAKGTITAGNSSQTSDGAAAVVLMSEAALVRSNLKPLGRFVGYAVAGVPPDIMGIGPVKAIPKALKQAGIKQDDIEWIELNEAFAAQSLAVIKDLGLDRTRVNPLGGAIALAGLCLALMWPRWRVWPPIIAWPAALLAGR